MEIKNLIIRDTEEDFSDVPLGNWLKAVRCARGLKQSYVAWKSGVEQASISRYERNECIPSLESLKKLCKVLNIKASDLLGF